MTNAATTLWERQPQAGISLWKALDFFEADKQRLTPLVSNLETRLEREPTLADLDIPASFQSASWRP